MKSKVIHALILAALAGSAHAAECGPDKLGTERTITLKREGALYGAQQHTALPLKQGEVVLTFDDGPSPENTQLVLKSLSDQCAKATFFMIGEHIAQQPELARRVVAEGHSAGIHSYTHPHMAATGAEAQLADLKKTLDVYRATFGASAPAYRFPFLEETPTLLAALKRTERMFGRRGGQRWGDRVLDCDVVLWSGGVVAEPRLSVPHPLFRQRHFVLGPAAAIAPGWRDPLTGLTLAHLHARLTRRRPLPR